MQKFSSPERIENAANQLGIHIYPTFNGNTRSLLVSDSQKTNKTFMKARSDNDKITWLQIHEDSAWKELMNESSCRVMQILLSIMTNPDLWNWLILVPWVRTVDWHSHNDNWLTRSVPNTRKVAVHQPMLSNLPLHTDSITSKYLDSTDSGNEIVVARVLHGIKLNPTGYYYLGDLMPDMLDNRAQSLKIAELIWYDAISLHKARESMRVKFEEIMAYTNFPSIVFNRSLDNSGFTMQAWTKYGSVSDISNLRFLNPVAHVWYLPGPNEPTWYLRNISLEDFECIFR